MNKLIIILLFLGLTGSVRAQLNSYKYIVVPKKFDAFKGIENHYQTSTLIKYLFTQEGFNVVYEDDLPADLANQQCLGAYVDLEKNSKLLSTRLTILLNDCSGATAFKALEGTSREKDFKLAYHGAIRESFVSIAQLGYKYEPQEKQGEETVTVDFSNDIKKVDTPSQNKAAAAAASAAVLQVATKEERIYEDKRPVPSEYTIEDNTETTAAEEVAAPIPSYVAKPIENGYELVDNESKTWLNLYDTSSPDVFLARNEKENGMVYKRDSKWFFEYYEESELKVQELNISFQ
ncbi:MAG: hypothetical protein ABF293_01240 [Flavobacteriaceae bacterium]